jgi:hypothetical protein
VVAKTGGPARVVAHDGCDAIAFADGALWVVDAGRLDRIDATTGEAKTLASWPETGTERYHAIAIAGGDAYVAWGGTEWTGLDVKNAGNPHAPPPKLVGSGQILKIALH